MWENEARFLAFLIGVFSCALPHLKVVSLLAVWFAPLPAKYTSNVLFILDVISKWSFLDLFVLTMYGQALNIKVERAFFASYDVNMSLLVRPGSFVFLGAVCYALLCSQIMIALHRSTSADGGHGSSGSGSNFAGRLGDGGDGSAARAADKRAHASSAPSSLGARAPSASIADAIVRAVGAPSVTARLHPASAVLDGALDPLQSAARRASASFSRAARGRASSRQSLASGECAAASSRPVARSYQLSSGRLTLDGAEGVADEGNAARLGAALKSGADALRVSLAAGQAASSVASSVASPTGAPAGALAEQPSSGARAWSRRVCAPLAPCMERAFAPLCCACGWWFLPIQRWLRPRKWWYFVCCSKAATKLVVALLIVAVAAAHIYAVTADCFLFAYGGVLGDTLLANYNAENIVNNRTTVEVYTVTRSIVAFATAISVENYIAPEGAGDWYNGAFNPAIYFPQAVVVLVAIAMPLVFLAALLFLWIAPARLVCACELETPPSAAQCAPFLGAVYAPPSATASATSLARCSELDGASGAPVGEGASDVGGSNATEDWTCEARGSGELAQGYVPATHGDYGGASFDVEDVVRAAAAATSTAAAQKARVYVKSALLTLVHFSSSWSGTDVFCLAIGLAAADLDTVLRATLLKIQPDELETLMANFCGAIAGTVSDARECLDIQPQLLRGFWALLAAVLAGYALFFYVDYVSTLELREAAEERAAAENGVRVAVLRRRRGGVGASFVLTSRTVSGASVSDHERMESDERLWDTLRRADDMVAAAAAAAATTSSGASTERSSAASSYGAV